MTPERSLADAAQSRDSRDVGEPGAQAARTAAAPLTRAELRRRREAATSSTTVPSLAESVIADAVAATLPLSRARADARPGISASARQDVDRAQDADAVVTTADTVDADPIPAPTADQASAADVPVRAEALDIDEFERAARLFAFTNAAAASAPNAATGSAPTAAARAAAVQSGDAAPAFGAAPTVDPAPTAAAHAAPRAGRVRGRVAVQRLATAGFSVTVMGVVGLFAIGTTLPASAVAAPRDPAVTEAEADAPAAPTIPKQDIQVYVAAADAPAPTLDRDQTYDVDVIPSPMEMAASSGVTQFADTWVNNPDSPIQWPFPVGVPVSAAFGSTSYLAQFARPHRGVDLTPGNGAEIHAIADGTVRIATEAGGDYGVTVVLDHVIDGKLVSTRYGHMQHGSLQVTQGQQVSVGDVLGLVGSTGKATGPHLHFEVLLNGTQRVDPYPWMMDHANK